MAVAPDGSLYVMDRGNYRVAHLAADGRFLDAFGRLGPGPAEIYAGWDVELDAAGNIYICNLVTREDGTGMAHDGVKIFTPAGGLVRELGGQDYEYDDGIPRNTPYDVDIDEQGRVYVANFGANVLQVFNAQGEPLARFFGETGSADGQFMGLVAVTVDDRRDLVYLIDHFNSRIQQFRRNIADAGQLTLTHTLTFGAYGRAAGQFAYPQYAAVDPQSGRVYVSDMGNQRIQVFNERGEYVAQFSPLAEAGLRTWQVLGITLGHDGAVYAVDALNNVIWVFEPDGQLRARLEV
jgi:DNA-binding beta-propeller fold protein YncE